MSRFQWAVLQLSLQSLYYFKVSYEQNVAVAMFFWPGTLNTCSAQTNGASGLSDMLSRHETCMKHILFVCTGKLVSQEPSPALSFL